MLQTSQDGKYTITVRIPTFSEKGIYDPLIDLALALPTDDPMASPPVPAPQSDTLNTNSIQSQASSASDSKGDSSKAGFCKSGALGGCIGGAGGVLVALLALGYLFFRWEKSRVQAVQRLDRGDEDLESGNKASIPVLLRIK